MTTKYAEQKAEEFEVITIFNDSEKSFQDIMEEILLMLLTLCLHEG